MGQSFFRWNGIDCRAMGIYLSSAAPIIRPEERVQHKQIPGRSGDLTQLEGEAVYNSYIQTETIHVKDAYNVRRVYDWLRGSGYVTFSGEPDRRQKARIVGAITLNKVSRNLDIWVGEVQFYCQPLKETLREEKTILGGPGNVINRGDVIERPIYKLTSMHSEMTLSVSRTSGSTTTLEALTITMPDSTIYVDSDTQEVWDSTRQYLLTKQCSGVFPTLGPGVNSVGGEWWYNVEITRRERFL